MRTPVAIVVVSLVLAACAPRRTAVPSASPGVRDDATAAGDGQRLAELFHARARAGASDYCLGPGDLLTVNVFAWEAMHDLHTRVSSIGTVSLPMLGEIPAAGRTETQLQAEIERRLRDGYMRDPHVSVFVQRFQSQQVSVTGAVARPGLYSLTRENRTLYDLLAQAGGQSEQAGGRILFSPATEAGCASAPAAARPVVAHAGDGAAATPIEIELDAPVAPGTPHPLTLPVMGGDSIVVSRGRFMVDGWVARPGLYSFTPGMTAYGAISVAGGALFPADLSHTEIVRARRDGSKEVLQVDLDRVGRGEVKDVSLREGDVIRFGASSIKMVPYSLYWVFNNLFRVGAGISVAGA